MKYIKTSQVYDQKNYSEMAELQIKILQDSYGHLEKLLFLNVIIHAKYIFVFSKNLILPPPVFYLIKYQAHT